MKVLYAIQGTGNGHLSRAREIIPELQKYCNVDILVSGIQADVELPFEIKYRYKGLSFIFGKKGGVDVWNTYVETNIKHLRSEIKMLPIKEYDFVINDFEPVSAWACYKNKVPCISLSHQSAVLNKNAPKPKNQDLLGKFILKNYAPSNMQFGLHFSRFSPNVFTPVIRKEIREASITNNGHFTVYLPSYSDEKLIKLLSQIDNVKWEVFSKHSREYMKNENIEIFPINNEAYIKSVCSSEGLLCGAGFEAPAEALHMGKKLMVVPMKSQYEQQCNAAALKKMGVPVIKKLREKRISKVQEWVDSDFKLEINYPDITNQIIKHIFEIHVQDLIRKNNWKQDFNLSYTPKENKREPTKKVLAELEKGF